MKNLKKLVIASFMLVIAFVAVVSSTYAWFTQGKDATVKDITIGVIDSEKALLIGKEDGVWSREVEVAFDGLLTPVTLTSTKSGEGTDASPYVYTVAENPFLQLNWSDELVPTVDPAAALNEKGTVEEYIVNTEAYSNTQTYYTRTGEQSPYTYAQANIEAFADNVTYYVKNPEYVYAGYITFDLYFQVTVDQVEDWTTSSISMDINKLIALNPLPANAQAGDEPTSNEKAISSFRLAVVESATATKELKDIAQGVGNNLTGVYGSGTQFAISNGWLEMFRTSNENKVDGQNEQPATYNKYIDKEAGENPTKYVLTHADAASSEKAKNIGDGYEYTMSCNSATAILHNDGLTRTFKITIYVWMEGWDGDNINAASGCKYTFGLSFEAR